MGLYEDMFSRSCGIDQPRAMSSPAGLFSDMANKRMSQGFEPIDWPRIIINQYHSESRARPMRTAEQLLYKGAVQAVKDAQDRVKG